MGLIHAEACRRLVVEADITFGGIGFQEFPIRLGEGDGNLAIGIERIVDAHIVVPSRPLQPLEAAGEAEGADAFGQFVAFDGIYRIGSQKPARGAVADAGTLPADEHERGGGDQLVADVIGLVGIDDVEEPIGQIGQLGGVGGDQEFDDAQLVLGHLQLRPGWYGVRFPSILSICSTGLQSAYHLPKE